MVGSPCEMKYDYITKLESLTNDLQVLIEDTKVNIDSSLRRNPTRDRSYKHYSEWGCVL